MYDFNGMPEGPMITGNWYNKRTGKTVFVRDMFMDEAGMQVMTSTGEMIDGEEFSRDYIQVSDDIYDESGKVVGKAEPTNDDVAAIAEYEKEFGVDPLVPQSTPTAAPINNEQIIKKVFDKLTSVPKIEVDVKWDDFPEAQINTLVEFLDVKFEDISAYIIKKYVNVEALALELTDILKEKLHKNIEDTIDE